MLYVTGRHPVTHVGREGGAWTGFGFFGVYLWRERLSGTDRERVSGCLSDGVVITENERSDSRSVDYNR